MESQANKAIQFRQLHRGPGVLILPNAWDVASARIFEEAGFPALATTSAGIAFSLGYPDGQRIPREEMMARIGRITRAVQVPVTADVEAGYGSMAGSTAEDAAKTTRELIQAGVAGMNLEDGSGDPARPLIDFQLAVEKIRAARQAAMQLHAQFVINARTDVYLLPGSNPDTDYSEAVRRLVAFRDAGADCVFAPGLKDAETIGRLAKVVECPLNILAGPGTPSIPELQKLGVARVSVGSGPMRATLGLLRRLAEELKASGTYSAMEEAVPYADVNKLLGG
jgi:2-methylisocitrate lyase-like PEP mutase family enzyme